MMVNELMDPVKCTITTSYKYHYILGPPNEGKAALIQSEDIS
jgi:hypothetical protein